MSGVGDVRNRPVGEAAASLANAGGGGGRHVPDMAGAVTAGRPARIV